MKELLYLPDEFKIKKKLTKAKFLSGAALLDSEKEKIDNLVADIDLLYDVKYQDSSEIIVIDVFLKRRLSFDTDTEIARIIAKSIPHHCIFLLHVDNFGRIIVFHTRQHRNDDRRKIIETQISSPVFPLDNLTPEIQEMIYCINEHLRSGKSAINTIKYCTNDIQNCKEEYVVDKEYKVGKENDEKIRALIEYGIDHPDEVLLRYGFHDGYDEDEIDLKHLEEALYNSAYSLYKEVANIFEEGDWLLLYAYCCMDLLEDYELFMSEFFYQRLGAAFSRRIDFLTNDECIKDIKEKLNEVYEILC